jgi:hypothetical protein
MSSALPETRNLNEVPDDEFWSECRRQAVTLNIPAWMIAEQSFVHGRVDGRAASQYRA